MSLLGKILAVLNILAAVLFVYLAAIDYARRQHWTYAVYRHELRLSGLPVDKDQRDLQGGLLVNKLDAAALNEVLGPGNPVKNQMEEVERVRGDRQRKIDDPAPLVIANPLDPKNKLELATKVQKLAWALRPFAIAADRREGLNRLMLDKDDRLANLRDVFPPVPAAELQKMDADAKRLTVQNIEAVQDPAKRRELVAERLQNELNKQFDVAPVPGRRDVESSRRDIARVLFGVAELTADEQPEPGKDRDLIGSPAYKRALAVVGLDAARREMDDQARNYDRLAQAVVAGMAQDRDLFAQQHEALVVRTLAAADELRARGLELQRDREKVQTHDELLVTRRKQVEELKARLAEKQKATRALLDEQTRLEQELFRSQQEFRDAAGQNFKLEEEIQKLEKGR